MFLPRLNGYIGSEAIVMALDPVYTYGTTILALFYT
jgi:hypothetical protein